jgi:rhodanese-related sulfurtransferase
VAVVLGLSTSALACSSSGEANNTYDRSIILDVRTPEEFAAGHLDGAVLVDIKDPSFDEKLTALDPSAPYVVYCRSGNRSAQAVERMKAAGFTDLTDLGSLENASSKTGIAIVQS